MGWREREYARFTREERARFYGPAAAPRRRASGRATCAGGAGLAVAVSGLLFLLGQVPKGHPVVPALHFRVPGVARAPASPRRPRPRVLPLRLPAVGAVSSSLTIHGRLPGYGGRLVVVEGRWNRRRWVTLATSRIGRRGAYRARFRLTRTGTLRVRLTYPDGTTSMGVMRVR
ncbi:MAG TPA: hypothetical protein VE596_09075 [Gaiellaceae bacterium]|nr:hypothetical protein [Gaiellaceae bacterium]